MKNFLPILFAGMLGGLITFGLIRVSENTEDQNTTVEYTPAVFTSSSNVPVVESPYDFINAAEITTPAVVHIKSEESETLARRRYQEDRDNRSFRSPFEELFGNDFFGDIFGRDFYRGPAKGSGSGVIISSDGYIVTNNHVVGFADKIVVTTNDGKKYNAKKLGTDPSSDLAVLKVEDTGLPYVRYGNSDKVRVGEWVLAVGNPFDYLTSTVTAGIVSAKGRDIDIIKDEKPIEEFIQTDAVINPGNSGGALVNTQGELIGINTAIATPTGVYAGYSFAIPSNLVNRIVSEIIENGDIDRANLGVYVRDVAQMAEEGEDVEADYGVYVDEIINGSSAQFAGVLPGDIIVNVDGKEIREFEDLKNALKFIKVGDTVKLKVVRDGARKTIPVKLKKGI